MSEYLKGQGINPGDPLPDNFFGQDDPYTVGENASSLVQYEPERLWEESSIDFDGIGNDLSGGGAAQYAQEAEKYEAWEAKQWDKAYLEAYEATDPSIRNLPSVEAEMGRQADMSVGIIEAHILPKLLEDQARIWMTASDSGYDEAAGDKALAASVMGTDIKDTRVLYAGEMGAARGTFRGELIGAFDDKIYQRIGDNTVVVHKVSDKLSKDRIGQAMEITCSEEKGRVLQQILEFKGDRGFALGNTAAKEQQAKQESKQSMGMGW